MKKVLCVLLALLVLFICPVALGAEDSDTEAIYFDASLTNAFGYSANTWFSSSKNRAELSWLLVLDIVMSSADGFDVSEMAEMMYSHTSYVGKSDSILTVSGRGNNYIIEIYYMPLLKMAAYTLIELSDLNDVSDAVFELAIEMTMENSCSDGYYKNGLSDILDIGGAIIEAIK